MTVQTRQDNVRHEDTKAKQHETRPGLNQIVRRTNVRQERTLMSPRRRYGSEACEYVQRKQRQSTKY